MIDYKLSPSTSDNKTSLKRLLFNSTLTDEEALSDIFLSQALHWQRNSLISEISSYANYLFGIFDILFGIFVSILCLATGYIGFIYIRASL